MKNRNPKVHTDCLMLSDWDKKKKKSGGPVYHLWAGARYCQQGISQFLCEMNNTKSSVLFPSEHKVSAAQANTAISVLHSLGAVNRTKVKGKAMASLFLA